MKPVLVAGHICLDIIPALGPGVDFQPGRLYEAGPAMFATGGAVANVGVALHRLGLPARLAGKVGADPMGGIVRSLLTQQGEGLDAGVVVDPAGETSYSIVLSSPGRDRTFLHHPGCNATFVSDDVSDEALSEACHLHFGYPPLMEAISRDNGVELADLLSLAKNHGLTTSLDMSLPDPESAAKDVDWEILLRRCLPWVDWFVPSLDELGAMLPMVMPLPQNLAESCLAMGCRAVMIKMGRDGVYGRSADGQAAFHACFKVEEKGTTGSGDATIAGFLASMLAGASLEEALKAGCAVGACSVEGVDAVSGIPSMAQVMARVEEGWETLE